MSQAQFTIPLIFQSDGNIIYAAEAMAELTNIGDNFNPEGMGGYQDTLAQKKLQEDPATGLTLSLAKDIEQLRFALNRALGSTTWWYEAPTASLGAVPPIGSIIPFYDFNGALTFDANFFAYCDGSTATVGGVSRTLPDLSGRYLVGFGTDGGGDNDSASWDTAAVGNAGHQINISHDHGAITGSSAPSTDSQGAHTHGTYVGAKDVAGTIIFGTGAWGSSVARAPNTNGGISGQGTTGATGNSGNLNCPDTASNGAHTHTVDSHTHSITSGLSSTQSIQPRSIRVRYLMRKA